MCWVDTMSANGSQRAVRAAPNQVGASPDVGYLSDDSDVESIDDIDANRLLIADLLHSTRFKLFMAAIILLNLVVMLMVVNHQGGAEDHHHPHLFLAAYTIECALRAYAFRWSFLFSASQGDADWFSEPFADEKDLLWSWFDLFIVTIGWTDVIMDLLTITNGSERQMMLMRTFRLLRVMRVMRIFKVVRPLQDLIAGLLNSMFSVFWVMVLLCTIMLVFAIFATSIFGQKADQYLDDSEAIEEHWGSVWRSFQTLFSFLTLDDWSNMTREAAWPREGMPLTLTMSLVSISALIGYTLLTAFVILSLLTGTMVEEVENIRTEHEEDETEDLCDALRGKTDKLFDFFMLFSHYNAEMKMQVLSSENLKQLLSDRICQEELKAVDIDRTRFTMQEMHDAMKLNVNSHGAITWNDFKQGDRKSVV